MLSGALVAAIVTVALSAAADNSAIVPISRDKEGWIARHQSMSDRLKEGHADVLWIGDSIVERWEKPGRSVWNKYYGHRHAVNLGISGDKTEHVLWRLDNCNLEKVSPKLAIVMIGQNNGGVNTAEEIAGGVTAIVMKLRQTLPDMKILLLAIFYRGEKPNDEQVKLAKTNEILSKLADDRHIFYLNINKIFLMPDGTIQKSLMPDFEHPNRKGCQAWAEAIEPKVAELLGETPVKPLHIPHPARHGQSKPARHGLCTP
jgi:lysophospholipase L1-like esterase